MRRGEGCMCPLINFHSPKPIPFAGYRYFGRGEGNRFSEYRGSIDSGEAMISKHYRSKQYCAFG